MDADSRDKTSRGTASQFYVAGELCRRGLTAVVTLGNCPNTDILCSNRDGTQFAHIQVKTFVPGIRTCSVGRKAETPYGPRFFWVLAGIPKPGSAAPFEYYVIPAQLMAENVRACHEAWLAAPGKHGQAHKDSSVRTVVLPPGLCRNGWGIAEYRDQWNLIESACSA